MTACARLRGMHMPEHFDVLIVGAGPFRHRRRLSPAGRNARARATRSSRAATASAAPGTCSAIPASAPTRDMYTLGYSFKPWTEAEGDRRRAVDPELRPRDRDARTASTRRSASTTGSSARRGRRRRRAGRSRPNAGGRGRHRDRALHLQFPVHVHGLLQLRGRLHAGVSGPRDFAGRIVHPQKWPEDLDYAGKRVVVIGSGATAVTLVPEMAKTAAHVTMLQRSPTYVVSRPAEDALANKLRAQSAGQARLSSDPLAQRAVRHVSSSSSRGASRSRSRS